MMETDGTKRDLENAPPWEVRGARAKETVANARIRREPDRTVPTGSQPHVYLAYCAGRLKIGTSIEPANRLRGLISQSPHPVTFLLLVPGHYDLEHRLHECLAGNRLHGEWFRITPDMRKKWLDVTLCQTGRRKFKKAEAEFRKWMREELRA